MTSQRAVRVLNVNDDEARRYLISHTLSRAGYQVVEAGDGASALSLAGRDTPDLILLDVRLPDLDGFEVCRRLKADPATATIPIVMVSSVLTGDADRVYGLDVGADGYLTDPQPAVTLATVRALLRARDAEAARRESELNYRALFEGNPLPAWVVDLDTLRVVAVNEAAVRELGYAREEFLAMTIDDFRPLEDIPRLMEIMTNPERGLDRAGRWRYRRKDGTTMEAEVTTRRVSHDGRDLRIVIARDVTGERHAAARHQTQLAVTRILASAETVADAAPRLLEAICEGLGWDAGELWRADAAASVLRLEASWQRPSTVPAEFEGVRRTTTIPRGVGLNGRAWDRGEPQWTADAATDPHFVGATTAAGAGLHGAVAFPVQTGGQTYRTMLFLARRFQAPDTALLAMMSDLAARIALFIERAGAEEAVREAEARYRLALEATDAFVWDWDVVRDRLVVSDAVRRMFGYRPTDANFAWWTERLHPDDREPVVARLHGLLAGAGRAWSAEYRFRRADGTYASLSDRGYVVRDARGGAVRMVCLATDVTEHRLREERDRLRALSLGMLRAREEEARRIARELHDEATQLLASVHLGLHRLGQDVPPDRQTQIEAIRASLDEAEARLRQVARELRPPILDDLGLGPAIEVLAESAAFRSSVRVEVDAALGERLPGLVETALYRVVQEALSNAARHAGTTRVIVTVKTAGDVVRCTIRDDGTGFDVETALATPGDRGLGLIGMRERVEALGGSLELVSSPGHGTEVRVDVPRSPHGPSGLTG